MTAVTRRTHRTTQGRRFAPGPSSKGAAAPTRPRDELRNAQEEIKDIDAANRLEPQKNTRSTYINNNSNQLDFS
jgi:hypothetical protein